jgi:hypothetical protein
VRYCETLLAAAITKLGGGRRFWQRNESCVLENPLYLEWVITYIRHQTSALNGEATRLSKTSGKRSVTQPTVHANYNVYLKNVLFSIYYVAHINIRPHSQGVEVK